MSTEIPRNIKYPRKFRNFIININIDLFLIKEKMDNLFIPYVEENEDEYSDIHYLVMALEDRRFLNHCGIDYKSIIRELRNVVRRRKCGGASTIDMQMVRTITGFKERTIYRKLYESILAFVINFKYSKRQIIDCYLENAFFGSHIYGINKAIRVCFNKYDMSALTFDEKSKLAAMLQIPRPLNPTLQWEKRVLARASYAQLIWGRMKNCNN